MPKKSEHAVKKPVWTKASRPKYEVVDDELTIVEGEREHFDQIILADDTFRVEIHPHKEQEGYYAYWVRMSGPLIFKNNKKNVYTTVKEAKNRSLSLLKAKFQQAMQEIDALAEKVQK